ncbi:MAG: hypothetical protein C4534_06610 [Gaiellales bacterium]|nr:MAG: hypothetical protein C4534_06610 [Gaiellales bacterium]
MTLGKRGAAISVFRKGAAALTPRRVLYLLMALALVLRVVSVLAREMIQLDQTVYAHMAESLAGGYGPRDITGVTSTNFLPTFPFFIAGLAAVFQDYVLSGYIVTVTFGVLLLVPVYLLGKELVGEKVGLMAAALVAVDPYLVDLSTQLYSESMFMFFVLLAILFSRHMVRGCRVPCSILAGSALGFAYLVNPTALIYLALFVLVALFTALRRGVWGHMVRALAVFLISFSVYAAPLVLYLHSEMGGWNVSGKNPVLVYSAGESVRGGTIGWDQRFMAVSAGGDEVYVNDLGDDYPGPALYLLEDPERSARTFLQQADIFYDEQLEQVFPRWLLPLVALGLFSAGWSRRQAAGAGFLLLMMSPALMLFFIDAVPRYFIPYTPLLMIWAAQGWLRLEDWSRETLGLNLEGRRRERLLGAAPALVALAVTLPLLLATPLRFARDSYPLAAREVGERIERAYGPGQRVMSREFSTAYYAGGEAVLFPYDDYDRVTEYARAQGVDLLVVGGNDISYWRTPMARLLEDGGHPEWELTDVAGEGDGEWRVYRFSG